MHALAISTSIKKSELEADHWDHLCTHLDMHGVTNFIQLRGTLVHQYKKHGDDADLLKFDPFFK